MSEVATTRTAAFEARLRKRYAAERRFKALGFGAILFSIGVLLFLLLTMTWNGIGGFSRVELAVPADLGGSGVKLDPTLQSDADKLRALQDQGLSAVIDKAAQDALGVDGAEQLGPDAWRDAARTIIAHPAILDGKVTLWLSSSDDLANAYRHEGQAALQPLADRLHGQGKLAKRFDGGFLTRSDATDPQQVGIWGALKGSILTLVVTLALAFPIGVLAALYLEEYAPRNRWTDLIEVSINNLAAVPSIIFGLLGLALFLGLFPSLRSAPLIGGMTLALMTMPVIVIAGRNENAIAALADSAILFPLAEQRCGKISGFDLVASPVFP